MSNCVLWIDAKEELSFVEAELEHWYECTDGLSELLGIEPGSWAVRGTAVALDALAARLADVFCGLDVELERRDNFDFGEEE